MSRYYRRRRKSPYLRYVLMTAATLAALFGAGSLLLHNPNAEDLYRDGVEALASGNARLSLDFFDKSLAKRPDDPRVYEKRAEANTQLERYEAALADYEEWRRLVPDSDNVIDKLAWLHLKMEQFDRAIERFQEGARRFPTRAGTFGISQGHVHYDWYLSLLNDATTLIRLVHRDITARPDEVIDLAKEFTWDLDDVITLEEVIAELPDGILDDTEKEISTTLVQARDHFRAAHQVLTPLYQAAVIPGASGHLLALLDYRAGHLYRSKLTCELLLALEPDYSTRKQLLELLANIHTDIGRFDLSARNFQEFTQIANQSAQPSLASLIEELKDRLDAGDYKYVLGATKGRVDAVPSDAMFAYLYSSAALAEGQAREAADTALLATKHIERGALAKSAPADEDKLRILWGLYKVLDATKHWKQAQELLDLVLRIDPKSIDALLKRARIEELVFRNLSSAGQSYFAILELSPRDSDVFESWDRVNEARLTRGGAKLEEVINTAAARWERFRSMPPPDAVDWRLRGEVEEARRVRWTLTAELEHDTYLIYRLALHYLEKRDVDEAIALLDRLAHRFQNVPEFPYRTSQIAYAQHRYDKALGGFLDVLERNPQDTAAARYAALSYRHLGNENEAAAIEAQLMTLQPERAGRIVAIGRALRSGDIERAEAIVQAGRRQYQDDLDLLALQGHVLLANRLTDKAQAAFSLVLTKRPFHKEALAGLIRVASAKRNPKLIAPLFDAIMLAPHGVLEDDIIELAELMANLGMTKEATQWIVNARKRFPYAQGLVTESGRLWVRMGNLKNADAQLALVDPEDTSDPVIDRFLVRMAIEDISQATRYLTDHRGRREGEAGYPSFIAAGNAARGARREAFRLLQTCRELGLRGEPHDTLLLLTRAILTTHPLDAIEGVPDVVGASTPLDPLATSTIGRDRDFDWLVDLGLENPELLDNLATSLIKSILFATRPSFANLADEAGRQAVELAPGCGLAARLRANRLANHRGRRQDAIDVLLTQLEIDSRDEESMRLYVELTRDIARTPEDLELARNRLVGVCGENAPVAPLFEARLASLRGETDLALEIITTVVNMRPKDIDPRLERARILIAANKPFAAHRSLIDTVRDFPQNEDARSSLTRLWRDYPQMPHGSEILLDVLRKNPFLYDLYPGVISDLSLEESQTWIPRLYRWLESATSPGVPSESLEALVSVALGLISIGENQSAQTLLERARTIDPAHPGLLEALGDVLYDTGHFADAARTYFLLETLYVAPTPVRARLAKLRFDLLGEFKEGAEMAERILKEASSPVPDAIEVIAEWDFLNNRTLSAAATLDWWIKLRTLTFGDRPPPLLDAVSLSRHHEVGTLFFLAKDAKDAVAHLRLVDQALPPHEASDQARLLLETMRSWPGESGAPARLPSPKEIEDGIQKALGARSLISDPNPRLSETIGPERFVLPDPNPGLQGPPIPENLLGDILAQEPLGPYPGENNDALSPSAEGQLQGDFLGPPAPASSNPLSPDLR